MNSKTQHSLFIIMERLWLIGALIGIGFTIYFLVGKESDSALFFLGFFILSAVLYSLRKYQRKKFEIANNMRKDEKKI
jgi:asparagine N-glycosylation enzyme membrane subunit Stt3